MDFARLDEIPMPGEKRVAVHVTPAAERAIRSGHPWVFDGAVRRQNRNGRCGDLAVIFDQKDRFLAIGLYDPASPIRIRVLHQGAPTPIDGDWLRGQMAAAAAVRAPLRRTHTDGYRLVHGGNDGLAGLVIDRYGQTCVLKLYTAAWIPHLRDVLAALADVTAPERVVLRLSRTVQQAPELLFGLQNGAVLAGPPLSEPITFWENGLQFMADVVAGQKTGFFLDQRDNRARVETLAAGKQVLNVFAYTGGFSLYAARGGATQVVSLDLSQPALAMAMQNFRLNVAETAVAAAEHELLVGDAFRVLQQLQQSHRRFDVVILDPPAFAHKQAQVQRALSAYGRLVRLGLRVLRRGGTLVTASCSSRVAAADFFETVHETAVRAKRPLQEIARTGHAIDHPISFPEGAYLKCLFAQVE